jgi:Methyltransferase domain
MKAKNILLTASLCAGIGLATLVAQTGDQQQQPTPTSSPMNMMGMMNMTPAHWKARRELTAAGMIEVARVKAAREHLPNLHSEVMPAETLACANGSMDAVISRFALMLFGNVAVSARELARELRAGGTSAWPCGTDRPPEAQPGHQLSPNTWFPILGKITA